MIRLVRKGYQGRQEEVRIDRGGYKINWDVLTAAVLNLGFT